MIKGKNSALTSAEFLIPEWAMEYHFKKRQENKGPQKGDAVL